MCVQVASEEVTVGEVKRLVEAGCGVPAHLQSLVVEGRALEGWYNAAVFTWQFLFQVLWLCYV